MTNLDQHLDLSDLLVGDAPAPSGKFTGMPRYCFLGGHNDPDRIPVEHLVDAAVSALSRDGEKLAIYNLGLGPQGYPPLRTQIAMNLAKHRGSSVTADGIIITHGSNQGIDLTCSLLVGPGDTVFIEELSYHGAITRFRKRGAQLVPIAMDADGMVVSDLATKLAQSKREGVRPKLIYTIPTVHNPTGSILPIGRRHDLVGLSRHFGVPILEDDCYADLLWGNAVAPPALQAIDPDHVIYIGSLSKSLAPALRLGFLTAPAGILDRAIAAKTDGGVGAIDQMVAAAYARDHFDDHVAMLRRTLQRKMDVMIEAVEEGFDGDAVVRAPRGGIFVWVSLPADVDVRLLAGPAAERGVVFNSGPEWAVDGESARSSLRLCFGFLNEKDIRDGVAALADAYRQTFHHKSPLITVQP